ncbi:hypothetical protein [Microbaculum marinum]|uniref:Uncharacterized protein n=1 Tax=Microbaculum marinum TaxID=1764581 RepID=A0AAW9RNL1_9HYPH
MADLARRALGVLTAVALASGAPLAPSAMAASPVPVMTVKIYNNTPDTNIYPVLTTGTSNSSLWLQAWFMVPKDQMGKNPYPKLNSFRFYVDPTGKGIPPGKSITLSVPLFTQLVPNRKVDPTKTDQFVDWWGGGRIEIFDAPAASGKPPVALTQLYTNRPTQTVASPILNTQVPTCDGCKDELIVFRDTGGGFKNNEPSQLTEYTMGAINQTTDPVTLDPQNVDIDISYVDTAYLPAAITPYNTMLPPIAQVGYVGTPQPISDFRAALNKFTAKKSPYAGWPQFIDNQGEKILKVPSLLHIFAGDPDMTPPPWPPVDDITAKWNKCIKPSSGSTYCQNIQTVREMFIANYKNYVSIYPKNCDTSKKPIALTEEVLIQQVYGFTPFNQNCADPTINLLENTPGYAAKGSARFHATKNIFDKLQYWPNGQFDPYVQLIHGKGYINAPNVYAYSVDDAVGNLQAEGTGFIIAVGGTNGLPNPKPAAPPINVNFGYSKKNAVRFTKYGICTLVPNRDVNPDYASIGLSILPENLDQCPLSFIDNTGELYVFKLDSAPPYPLGVNKLTPATHAPIDCSGAGREASWCGQIFAYSEEPVGIGPITSYVITPAPAQP